MADEEQVGTVQVKIGRGQVHRAVQNILHNELRIDAEEIKTWVRTDADKTIEEQVLKYLRGTGYDEARLQDRVNRTLVAYEGRIEQMVKDAIAVQVRAHILSLVQSTVEMVVKNADFRIGWGNTATKVTLKTGDSQ